MKNTLKILSIIALIAVIGFATVSCGDDGGGSSGASLPSIKSASAVQNFAGAPVTSRSNAIGLWNQLVNSSFFVELIGVDSDVFDVLETARYANWDAFVAANGSKKALNETFNIDDSAALATEFTTVTAGTIKGRSNTKYTFGKTINEIIASWELPPVPPVVGASSSSSFSQNREFNISAGHWAGSGLQVSGFVSASLSYNEKSTVKEGLPNVFSAYTENASGSFSVTLSVSDGANGAKFRFAAAGNNTDVHRSLSNNSSMIFSNLEVLNNANQVIYTIRAEEIADGDILTFGFMLANFTYW